MIFIKHRINTIESLEKLEPAYGAEIDLRSLPEHAGRIHLAHDPWVVGDDFGVWLHKFAQSNRGPLILNTKEDGLEEQTMKMLAHEKLSDYFFLDTTAPTLIKYIKRGMGHYFAGRVSSYEDAKFVNQFCGQITWVWLDCFSGEPVSSLIAQELVKNFKICLVSPELHGVDVVNIAKFRELSKYASAVCTKFPEKWEKN